MNTPMQQADLYRKAAETIEMCAKHGIEPCIKYINSVRGLCSLSLNDRFDRFEFPISIIEGQLVWADTIVYSEIWRNGVPAYSCSLKRNNDENWSLNPPKRTVMVELLIEDVDYIANATSYNKTNAKRVKEYCLKALDNLKG